MEKIIRFQYSQSCSVTQKNLVSERERERAKEGGREDDHYVPIRARAMIKKECRSRMWWHVPCCPSNWDSKAGESLELRSLRALWAT